MDLEQEFWDAACEYHVENNERQSCDQHASSEAAKLANRASSFEEAAKLANHGNPINATILEANCLWGVMNDLQPMELSEVEATIAKRFINGVHVPDIESKTTSLTMGGVKSLHTR